MATRANVLDREARKSIYRALICSLEDADWDTQDEVAGLDVIFDETLAQLHAHGN